MTYAVIGRVYGHVQGVGFRYFVKRNALSAQVSGWARNCADGSVEVVLSGNRDSVIHLQEVVAAGPEQANVQTISWKPINEDQEHIRGFDIR